MSRTVVRVMSILIASCMATACGPPSANDDVEPRTRRGGSAANPPRIVLKTVGRFHAPIAAVAVPGTDLIAIVERGGRVLIVSGMTCASSAQCPSRPVTRGSVVLDISRAVGTEGEGGLLGLAFHPTWPDDPRIFLNYTDTAGDTHLEAWTLDVPTDRAQLDRELLRIDQPFSNHNGGHLAFGPDRLLYIGTGDGGASGDPADRAQKTGDLLGKLLRLDVDRGDERGFAIPPDNVERGAPEVWAVGLRNPWRFSFDRTTGDLWIGDVGQDEHEEIDALRRARLDDSTTPNFGWRLREGYSTFDTSGVTGPSPLIHPVLEYSHEAGCSVTGGVVYRGTMIPRLRGWYVFADYCANDLRLLRTDGVPGSAPKRGELRYRAVPGAEQVVSFGETRSGEVLVVSLDGTVRQVVGA